jgi:hypothetical protein
MLQGTTCGGRDPGIIDVVMDQNHPETRSVCPDPAISDHLSHPIRDEEAIEASLPNAAGVTTPWHITHNFEEVAATRGIMLWVWAVKLQPPWDYMWVSGVEFTRNREI